MRTQLLFVMLAFCSLLHAAPKLELPAILSSNMVLQRSTDVNLWGWTDKNEKITLSCSWLSDPISVKADNSGKWTVKVHTTSSKESQIITIRGNDTTILLDNILFGEVWLCSGQSNMQMSLNGYTGQPVLGALDAISHSEKSTIRLFHVTRKGTKIPLNDLQDCRDWQQVSPNNVGEFSAVAYFFGKQLNEILNVPVGLIHASWGGSEIEAWMSEEALQPIKPFVKDSFTFKRALNHTPTALFNAMIKPLIPFSVKGFLWYQGESNRYEPLLYEKLFPAMVNDWRTRWQNEEMPIYYVQIAPYHYRARQAFDSIDNTAYLREAQLKCMDVIPYSGMAVTLDVGEEGCIHPAHKKEVADRLLYQALNKTYGYKTVDCDGPKYKSIEIKDGGIYIEFNNAENGIYIPDGLDDFVIAGEDKVFYPATANMKSRQKVFVKSSNVPNPVAVRYGWCNWLKGSLFDTNLLPASSFRSDDWEDSRLEKK